MKHVLCFFTAAILLISCVTSVPKKTDRLNAKISKLLKKAGWAVYSDGGGDTAAWDTLGGTGLVLDIDSNITICTGCHGGSTLVIDSASTSSPDCLYCGTGFYTEKGDSMPPRYDSIYLVDDWLLGSRLVNGFSLFGPNSTFAFVNDIGDDVLNRDSSGHWTLRGSLDSTLEIFYQSYKALSESNDSLKKEIRNRDYRINRLLNL